MTERRKLPDTRPAFTHTGNIAGTKIYITVGLFDDGSPGELFVTLQKTGGIESGFMRCLCLSVSLNLQYGVPLKKLVDHFSFQRFDPSGFTTNPEIHHATSIVDYVFRWMENKFLKP